MAEEIVVLHVDDEPDFAELAAEFLEREDGRIEVVTATSAEAGLGQLRRHDVDCIVSDYDMPGTNGLELLEQVREGDPDQPFILFTGKGSEEVASEALSKGATDYLQKEAGTDQYAILANRVLNYVETAQAEAQRRRQLDAIETANEGISILDSEGEFIYVNQAYADLYGYEPAEMVGEHWEMLYPPDEADRAREEVMPQLEETGSWRGETIGLRADGSTFVEDHALTRTDRGELICTIRDVTERQERKRALERYRTVVEAMGDGVYALDAEGGVIHANDVLLDMLGVEYEYLLESDMSEFFTPEEIDRFESAIGSLIRGESEPPETIRATVSNPDDEEIPLEVSLTLLPMPDGEFRGTVGVVRDIGDRLEGVSELETYRNAFESTLSPIVVADTDGCLVAVNRAFLDLWGYDEESAVLGRHVSEFWTEPEEAEVVAEQVAIDGTWRGTLEADMADGTARTLECAASTITDEDGVVTGYMSSFLDVSDRREREELLERYETLLDVMPDTVVVTDLEGVLQDLHGFEGWSDYEYDELVGEHMSMTMPPEDVERAEGVVADIILDEAKTTGTFEHTIVTKSGERVPFENHITVLPENEDGEIPGTMSVLRNIAGRKERERELERQNERLEEFAGIVSHDLRNPLNVAAGRLQLAERECDSEHLEPVGVALDRMETLIEDLLTLSRERRPVEDYETVRLSEVTAACWKTVQTGDARLDLDGDRPVEADRSRLRQLLENLLRNAVEHGGEDVTICVGALESGGGFFVADDGPGIPEDEREAVFESGYSTVPDGTGFGLSIVKEVAEAHGWDVDVTESESGGARFEMRWTDELAL